MDTFQVTNADCPVFHVTLVLGLVTANAVVVLITFTFTVSSGCITPPPPIRLSLTVILNFKVRAYEGSNSPMVVTLFTISLIFGNVLLGLLTGEKGLKIGASPTGAFQLPAAPRSNSSQQYVKASPLASLPVAVSSNGV